MSIFDKSKLYLFDGSKGFMLQKYGLAKGVLAESYNLTHPEVVLRIYQEYCDAGADIIQTNTLCANSYVLSRYDMQSQLVEMNETSIDLARQAAAPKGVLVAASIGPIGDLLEPFGPLSFDNVYSLFKEQISACSKADIINFETFTDLRELRIALLANKDSANLPVICNMTYEANQVSLMGQSPFVCSGILKRLGADVVGVNCSHGPEDMSGILKEIACFEDFVCVKPNAGMPKYIDNMPYYDQSKEDFCRYNDALLKYNIGISGGCCGTTPEFIKEMNYIKSIKRQVSVPIDKSKYIFSQFNYVDIEKKYYEYVLDISAKDIEDSIEDAYDLLEEEYDVICIKYDGKDTEFISKLIIDIQNIIKQPLVFDFSDQQALQIALLHYCGIAGVKQESSPVYAAYKVT